MNNFERIAGYEKEKEQLKGLRELLLHLDDYKKSGIRIPRGVLLYGAPGVGKTVMAKAIAEAPISCVELCSADCTREDAADYVLQVFEKARENAPSVLLIDELDKIAEGSRDYYMEGNDRIMKILLQELDGQKNNSGVLVVATCNHYDQLNPALLRSGRFDRLIQIGNPSLNDRKAIIRYYLSKVKMEKTIDDTYFANITGGYTGAQLECVINEAGILAMEEKHTSISIENVRTAMNRISFRSLEGKTESDKDLHIVATHEAGHALLALLLSPDKLTGASVIPHGSTRGFVRMRMSEETDIQSKEEIEARATIALGGAAAEDIALGTRYLSCADDLSKAAYQIQSLICNIGCYGLELLSPMGFNRPEFAISEKKHEKIDEKRSEILAELYEKAKRLIHENRAAFDAIVKGLVERCSLTKEEIEDIYRDVRKEKNAA